MNCQVKFFCEGSFQNFYFLDDTEENADGASNRLLFSYLHLFRIIPEKFKVKYHSYFLSV